LEHVFQCESGNADAVFKHIDVAILVKLKHLVDGFQHGFDVFVVVDISNYLAPGFSYSQYLKAYKCTEQKGFVPYEWMTSLDKLNVSQLPPVPFHGILDLVTVHQSSKKIYLHGVDVIFPRIETDHGEFL
jgi:hypothetical protein